MSEEIKPIEEEEDMGVSLLFRKPRDKDIPKGIKMGRLSFLEEVNEEGVVGRARGERRIKCVCDCGAIRIVKLGHFVSGRSNSCGCYKITHGLSKTKIYRVWLSMKKRCLDKRFHMYKSYGAIGVKICDEWINDCELFCDWAINNGWEDGLQLDKDIKGNGFLYSPETCCFVTFRENQQYKKGSVKVIYDGSILSCVGLAEKLGIRYSKAYHLIKRGIYQKYIKPTNVTWKELM